MACSVVFAEVEGVSLQLSCSSNVAANLTPNIKVHCLSCCPVTEDIAVGITFPAKGCFGRTCFCSEVSWFGDGIAVYMISDGTAHSSAAREDYFTNYVVYCIRALAVVLAASPCETDVSVVRNLNINCVGFVLAIAVCAIKVLIGIGADNYACRNICYRNGCIVPTITPLVDENKLNLAHIVGEVGIEGDRTCPFADVATILRAYLYNICSGEVKPGQSGGIAYIFCHYTIYFDIERRSIAYPTYCCLSAASIVDGDIRGLRYRRWQAWCIIEGGLGQEVLLADAGVITAKGNSCHLLANPGYILIIASCGLVDAHQEVAALIVDGIVEGYGHLVAHDGQAAGINLLL